MFYNEDTQVLGIVTGIGTAKSASAIMALGLDSRLDLSNAYWIIAGIAGIDPEDASIGSAVWSSYLVDGDLAHEIDPREMIIGILVISRVILLRLSIRIIPAPTGEMFVANENLRDWAFDQTKDIVLPDTRSLEETRMLYTEHTNARKPPFVLKGGHIAAMTFWHGEILNEWANRWVAYWTNQNREGDLCNGRYGDFSILGVFRSYRSCR